MPLYEVGDVLDKEVDVPDADDHWTEVVHASVQTDLTGLDMENLLKSREEAFTLCQ